VKTMAKVKTTIKDIGNTLTSLSTTCTFKDYYKDDIDTNAVSILQQTNLEVPQGQHVLIFISIKYDRSYEQVAFVNMVHDGSMKIEGWNNTMSTKYVVTSRSNGIGVYVGNTLSKKINAVYHTFTIIGV
jgi:hypothetical protein